MESPARPGPRRGSNELLVNANGAGDTCFPAKFTRMRTLQISRDPTFPPLSDTIVRDVLSRLQPCIQNLYMNFISLNSQNADVLARKVKEAKSTVRLQVDGCDLANAQIILGTGTKITHVSICHNPVASEIIAGALKTNRSLRVLDMWGVPGGCDGMGAAMRINTTLQNLTLSCGNASSTITFFNFMQDNTSLLELEVYGELFESEIFSSTDSPG